MRDPREGGDRLVAPADRREAARAERYRLAQAAKIIRQLEEVVLVGDARDMKKKRKPQKPQK